MKGKIVTLLFMAYCILMPFEEAIAFGFGSVLKIVGMLIIGLSLFFYIARKPSATIKPLIFWLALMLISYLWCTSSYYWEAFIIIYLGQIALLVAFELVDVRDFNFKMIDVGLIITGCVASYVLIKFPATSMLTDEGRRTIMINGTSIDPNIVAATIIIGLHITTNFFLTCRRKIIKYIYGSAALFMLYGILLTGSRGALIAFVASFALKIYLEGKLSLKARKKSIYLILFAIVAFFVMLAILPENLIESRFSKETILGLNEREQGSHNRYDIWLAAIDLFTMNPILGVGCGNFINSIALVYSRQCASHNMYILLLIEGGVIGFSLFAKYVYSIWKSLMRYCDYLTLSLLTATLIISLSLDALPYKFFWITLIYCRLQIRRREIGLENEDC